MNDPNDLVVTSSQRPHQTDTAEQGRISASDFEGVHQAKGDGKLGESKTSENLVGDLVPDVILHAPATSPPLAVAPDDIEMQPQAGGDSADFSQV